MGKKVTVKINGDALRAEIFRKGMTLIEASLKLGFEKSYISKAIKAGKLPNRRVNTIEAILGIKPEKYVISEEVPAQEEQLEIVEANTDGDMVRNIDVEFVKFRARELGFQLKSFCDVMGKRDNYLYNLKTNGATREDFDLMLRVLRLEKNDPRIIRKPEPIETAGQETVGDIKTAIHKHESKLADLYGRIRELEEANKELTRQIEGQKRLAGAIVGSLARSGIVVDGKKTNGGAV